VQLHKKNQSEKKQRDKVNTTNSKKVPLYDLPNLKSLRAFPLLSIPFHNQPNADLRSPGTEKGKELR
jgi:hypothetical protein